MGCGNTGGPSNGRTAEKFGGQLNANQVTLPQIRSVIYYHPDAQSMSK